LFVHWFGLPRSASGAGGWAFGGFTLEAHMKETVFYCSPQVRRLWPSPLAAQWASLYPQLFDRDDVRITQLQPKNHFSEWFAAIHLFHRDGVLSLVEKGCPCVCKGEGRFHTSNREEWN